MSKKMKVLAAVLVAVFVLIGVSTAVVMAQEEPQPPPETERNGLFTRVSEILGIPEDELIAAFEQAQLEIREEALNQFLEKAVEQERITQEEADEILEWWEQRPEVANESLPPGLGLRAGNRLTWCPAPGVQIWQYQQEFQRQHRLGPPWSSETE